MKDKRIVVLVDDSEKAEFENKATKRGFDSVAAYLRWLARRDNDNEKDK